jgi:hypothetical protein
MVLVERKFFVGRVGSSICIVLLGVALAVPPLAIEAGQARLDFAPHRALYSMSLGQKKANSSIVDVNGRMAFEWRTDCDGWVVEQRYAVRYFSASSKVREVDTWFTAWESKDGKRYKFYVANKPGRSSMEKIEGFASRPGANVTGAARFTAPEETNFELPAAVLFPSSHTFAMIDSALGGGKFFSVPIFDGSELEGATSVSAAMGLERTDTEAREPLLAGKHWPVRMAFFSAGSQSSQPTYEMSVNMHANGVATGMVLDYGDITVKVDLQSIEALPQPDC